MKKSRIHLLAVALCAVLAAAVGCSEGPAYRSLSGAAWGTCYHITYAADRDLQDSVASEIRAVDLSLSPFAEGSLVQRLNQGEEVVADRRFADVFGLSCHVCSVSGGAFDPTVAPLVNLWGFGYRQADDPVPSPQALDSALRCVGLLDCSLRPDGRVVKKAPATEFDFSAVAKGYGVDCVAGALRRAGCADYMVEIGGEIALAGKNPRGEDWVIQVDSPVDDLSGTSHAPVAYLQLTDAAIATSGNYRNYRETPDGRVGHTISPRTGLPVQTATLSATVVAPACGLADALATACMAMPPDSAMAMIEAEHSAECMLVCAADSAYDIRLSSGFARFVKEF